MGGDEGGGVFGADEAEKFGENDFGRGNVQVAGWFVGEQDGGFVSEGAGDGHALLFAAGEFAGEVICAGGEAERAEEVHGAFFGMRLGFAGDHLRQHDVFHRGEFGEEMVELVDDADGAETNFGAFSVSEFAGIRAVDDDGAAIRFFQEPCQVKQG